MEIIGCWTIYSSIDFICFQSKKLLASWCLKDWIHNNNCAVLWKKSINSLGDDANMEGNQWTRLVDLSYHFCLGLCLSFSSPCLLYWHLTSFLSPAQKTLLLHFCILLRGDDSFFDMRWLQIGCTRIMLRNTTDWLSKKRNCFILFLRQYSSSWHERRYHGSHCQKDIAHFITNLPPLL